jgi:V-type H+-transporting ATPase subunit F
MSGKQRFKTLEEGHLIAVIGDEDTVTGLLLAGVGHVEGTARISNFLVVTSKTETTDIERAFKAFTSREDIAILLINQFIATRIRELIDEHTSLLPTIVEIPSKEHPYDESKDTMMQRVRLLTAER